MENDPSARVTRVSTPVASPGTCVICGKNEHPKGFAATDNLDFEFYGTVYFCYDCVGDYARVMGYIGEEERIQLVTSIEAQNKELNTLRQAVLGLEATVDGLIADAHRRSTERADAITGSRNDNASVSSFSNPVDEPDEGLPDESSAQSDSDVRVPERVHAEPVVQQGPDDLYDTTVADELLGL